MKRLKVLISAHELSPVQGSECAEGWNIVTRLAEYHDVTVIYAKGSQFSPNDYELAVEAWLSESGNLQNVPVFVAVHTKRTPPKTPASTLHSYTRPSKFFFWH